MKTILSIIAVTLLLSTAPALAADKPVKPAGPAQAIDPVCGMTVDTKDAKFVYEYKGRKYYFCMKADMDKFKANPKKYTKK